VAERLAASQEGLSSTELVNIIFSILLHSGRFNFFRLLVCCICDLISINVTSTICFDLMRSSSSYNIYFYSL
jgi:hypothetical protein